LRVALLARLIIFLRRCGMAHAGEEEREILLAAEVESFLDDLYESDPGEPPAGEPGHPHP
jgi:hypothetical protein